MKTTEKREKPEAIRRLEELWPKLNEVRRLKVESIVQALAYLVHDETKEKEATA
ncbi:MAG: hypothetical protein IKH16_12455 [Selenomonadaceae bacterium]|nr:hypothetical protein [Selenomonadaceae bacterium]MBR4695487.1 hypothetical protein [Selenomonadaceae bacterium]